MRGRVPRPREERLREGRTRNLPDVVRVSGRADLADVLEPPAHLGKEATAWWHEVAPALAKAGLLERVDRYVLGMCAAAYGDVVRMDRVISVKGMFTTGSVGNIVEAPWVKIRRDSMAMFERYLNHLALSPVARTRLGLAHLHGQALMREMDEDLAPADGVIDAEAVYDDAYDVGLPGV